MKEMNRREFLTLTGAAVVALRRALRTARTSRSTHRQGSQSAGGHQQVSWSTARAYAG